MDAACEFFLYPNYLKPAQCDFGIVHSGSRDAAEARSGLHWRGYVGHSGCAGWYGSDISCTEELFDFFQELHRMNRLGEEFKAMAMCAGVV